MKQNEGKERLDKNIYDIWQYILHENTHTPKTTDGLVKKWSDALVSKACKLKPCNTVSNHQIGKNWNNSNAQETQGNKNAQEIRIYIKQYNVQEIKILRHYW